MHRAIPAITRLTRGLTLIELLIGVALAGILLAQAAPSFQTWLARSRLLAQTSALTSSLSYAKSEAVRRGVRVTVCKSSAPGAVTPACSIGGSWSAGWLVFVDNTQVAGNLAGTVDGTDMLLRIGEPLQDAITSADASLANWIAFTPDGLAVASGGTSVGTITICQGSTGRTVTLNTIGRTSTASTTC